MSSLKIMTIVGTRPEIIRLAAVIKKCDRYFEQILVHTGQNYDYELNQVFFNDLGLRAPDFYLDAVGGDLGETIGNIIAKSYKLMAEQKPDALLILGDTNSCLSAISAKRLHIPIFHMEAGNRCFDECLPEETNRRIVDHISDVNLCYSEHARRYLNAEGTARERTYVVGSPMAEVLHENLSAIENSDIHQRLGLEPGRYILLSAHREENIDTEKNFFSLMNSSNTAPALVLWSVFDFSFSTGMWAVSGLALSAVFPDIFVAFCAPVIMNYLLEFVSFEVDFFPDLLALSLTHTDISDNRAICAVYIISVLTLLTVVFAFIFSKAAGRRIRNEMR